MHPKFIYSGPTWTNTPKWTLLPPYRVSAAWDSKHILCVYIYSIWEMVLVTRNDSNRDSLILFLFVSQAYICMLPPNFPAVEWSKHRGLAWNSSSCHTLLLIGKLLCTSKTSKCSKEVGSVAATSHCSQAVGGWTLDCPVIHDLFIGILINLKRVGEVVPWTSHVPERHVIINLPKNKNTT